MLKPCCFVFPFFSLLAAGEPSSNAMIQNDRVEPLFFLTFALALVEECGEPTRGYGLENACMVAVVVLMK